MKIYHVFVSLLVYNEEDTARPFITRTRSIPCETYNKQKKRKTKEEVHQELYFIYISIRYNQLPFHEEKKNEKEKESAKHSFFPKKTNKISLVMCCTRKCHLPVR